jgi:lia operon protein LiaF
MRKTFSFVFGGVLVFFGLVFLLDNLGYVDSDWILGHFWPLLLILAGIVLLVRRPLSRQRFDYDTARSSPSASGSTVNETSGDHIAESEVFGNIRRQYTSKNFTGGSCSVVFGDMKLDLTKVELMPGEQELRFNSVFGSVRLELPVDLEYSLKATFVAGGLNVKGERRGGIFQSVAVRSANFATADKRLAIFASSVFGDIKIV